MVVIMMAFRNARCVFRSGSRFGLRMLRGTAGGFRGGLDWLSTHAAKPVAFPVAMTANAANATGSFFRNLFRDVIRAIYGIRIGDQALHRCQRCRHFILTRFRASHSWFQTPKELIQMRTGRVIRLARGGTTRPRTKRGLLW